MSKYAGTIFILLSLLAGAVIGAVLHSWWQHHLESKKRRIPKAWPLSVRNMVNTRERRTWHWLVRNFMDYHVMVKMPLTRFTMPQFKSEGQHWFELLSGVYCTFTICSPNGTVIGCVDVPGAMGLSLSNQALKHSLLSQCNISYWVLDPDKLPNPKEIRYAFLGSEALHEDEKLRHSEEEFSESRAHLHAVLDRQRHQKEKTFTRAESQVGKPAEPFDSQLHSGWQENSFVAPLDSRSADLR